MLRLTLSSRPRPVTMKIFSARPTRVECDGVRLPGYTSAIAFARSAQGWRYAAPFVLVKFKSAGGTDLIVVQGSDSTR